MSADAPAEPAVSVSTLSIFSSIVAITSACADGDEKCGRRMNQHTSAATMRAAVIIQRVRSGIDAPGSAAAPDGSPTSMNAASRDSPSGYPSSKPRSTSTYPYLSSSRVRSRSVPRRSSPFICASQSCGQVRFAPEGARTLGRYRARQPNHAALPNLCCHFSSRPASIGKRGDSGGGNATRAAALRADRDADRSRDATRGQERYVQMDGITRARRCRARTARSSPNRCTGR